MSQNYAPEAEQETVAPQSEILQPERLWRWELPLSKRRCPRCDSDRMHRSHRRSSWERVLALVALPYRCEFCALRFFRLRGPGAER